MTFTLSEESILDAFKSDERMTEKCFQISQDLVNNKYDISSIIEQLGFALTSAEVELRVNGTKFLSRTLAKLPTNYLTAKQLDFIVAFYCDRLKDHHNVIPAIIDGLTSLVQMNNLSEGSITKVMTTFFQHVVCHSQNRDDREKIYKLIDSISAHHTKELTGLGTDYVYNVINAVDGERDPRNLCLLFEFMPRFIKLFPLQHLAEEMFETFACYFPVDFNPMKDDPTSISRDLLAQKLGNCLVANEAFSEWAIPLALEKLESDLVVAKLDSLALLTRCAENFKAEQIEEQFDDIWTRLKTEILPGSGNSDIVNASFATLDAVLLNATKNPNISKSIETKILSNIIPYVSNISHHLFAQAFHIAGVCVKHSPLFAGEKILGAVALRLQENELAADAKIKLIACTNRILEICSSKQIFDEMDQTIRGQIQKQLLDILKIDNAELLTLAWKSIENTRGVFTTEQRVELYSRMVDTIADDKHAIDLSGVISNYGTTYPDEINVNVIDRIASNLASLSANSRRNILLNLVPLVQLPQYEEKVMILLAKQLFESDSKEEIETGLRALRKLLDAVQEANLAKRIWSNYNLFENFKKLIETRNLDNDTLTQISYMISLLVRQLSVEDQQSILDKHLLEFQVQSASELFLLHGVLGHVNEKVTVGSHFSHLVTKLVHLCLTVEDEVVQNVGRSLLCSLMNRIERTEENHATIKKVLVMLRDEIRKGRKEAAIILAWIGKGLMVRGYEESGEIVEDISELLKHPTLSETAELAFDIISMEVPELHLPIVKVLFKQKIFHTILNKLWEKLVQYEERHVNAFAFILRMAPYAVLKIYLEKIGNIIFKCIESTKPETVQIGLKVIKEFLQDKSEYFRSHFNHLIPQLVKLSSRPDSMSIRIAALECLGVICNYPTFVVQPYKIDVVLGLASTLDDKKRLVRNTAVITRNAWYLVGTEKTADK